MAKKINLNPIIREKYLNGLIDENFVMEAITSTLGGKCEKSSQEEDIIKHVDFWWYSPKKGKIGIDVKGIKKNNRKDNNVDDTIHWIEIQNVNGKKGWIYGKSEYIAFRTLSQIIFVKTNNLIEISENVLKTNNIVDCNPKECYIPYQRYQRKDIIYKIPTNELIKISDFIIDC
jgi:hypothetical protein